MISRALTRIDRGGEETAMLSTGCGSAARRWLQRAAATLGLNTRTQPNDLVSGSVPDPEPTILSMIPDFFVPISLVVQQRQQMSLRMHTNIPDTSVEDLRNSAGMWHQWVEWSPDGQLIRRRPQPSPSELTRAPQHCHTVSAEPGYLGECRGHVANHSVAIPRHAYHSHKNDLYALTVTTPSRTASVCVSGRADCTLLHDALDLLALVVPTFPVPVDTVETVMQSWWSTPSSDSPKQGHLTSLSDQSNVTALRRRFPTATALLAHPQLQFALCISSSTSMNTPEQVQLHPRFSHARRGCADTLYAGLDLAAVTACRGVALSPPASTLCLPWLSHRSVLMPSLEALLARLQRPLTTNLQTPAPWPLAMWIEKANTDVVRVAAWEGQPLLRGHLLYTSVKLTYTAVHGYALPQEDCHRLAAAADRVLVVLPERTNPTSSRSTVNQGMAVAEETSLLALLQLQWRTTCPTLCVGDLAALAEITGVPLGDLWHKATPLWQATRLARFLGLSLTTPAREGGGVGDVASATAEQVSHPIPTAMVWAAVATAVAAALLQRDRESAPVRKDVSASLAHRLAAPRPDRIRHGLNCHCFHTIRSIEGACCTTEDARRALPSLRTLEVLHGMSESEKERLVRRLVALWGPEDAVVSTQYDRAVTATQTAPTCPREDNRTAAQQVFDGTCTSGCAQTQVSTNADQPPPRSCGESPTAPLSDTAAMTAPSATEKVSDALDTNFLDEAFFSRTVRGAPAAPRPTATAHQPFDTSQVAHLSTMRKEATLDPEAARLPPSFIQHEGTIFSPPSRASSPSTSLRRSAPLAQRRHRPRTQPERAQKPTSVRPSNAWQHRDGARADVPHHSDVTDSIVARDLVLDIFDAAASSTQRRLRPWQS